MKIDYDHVTIMPNEVAQELNIRPDGIYVDGTLGGGGHAARILEKLGGKGKLIGIDRDEEALKAAAGRLNQYEAEKKYVYGDYSDIKTILNEKSIANIDGAILDIGVSSFQLDSEHRGFSYMQDAPLDMRMDQNASLTAESVVNDYSENEISRILREYGEERWASRIAKFITEARKKSRIRTSSELVSIIKAAIPKGARKEGPHPAKRTFQAIRIEVNGELDKLKKGTEDFIDVLAPGGRLAVITFHSLEDRIVKEAFMHGEDPCTCPKDLPVCVCGAKSYGHRVNKKPITAGEAELKENHRARSAKLRVFEKAAS